MHRMVGAVFKVIGISVILMIIMDVLFIVADTITVNNRVTTLSTVIQDELSRNNCIPDDIAVLFDSQLQDIEDKSNIATNIEWNLTKSITVDGVTYPPINESNVKDYGENLSLVIVVDMEPHSIMWYRDTTSTGSLVGTNIFKYTDEYVSHVPALRYLK